MYYNLLQILKDELERTNIKVLLKSIKDSIPELSGACQDSLNANSFQLFKVNSIIMYYFHLL